MGAIAPIFVDLSVKPSLSSNPQAVKIVFNELFDRQQSESNERSWKKLNIAEFFGIYGMTAIIICTYFEYSIIICVESSMSHLIINISGLARYRSNAVFIIFAYFCEAYVFAIWLVHTGFFLSLQCLVISKAESTMEDIQTNLR